MLCAKQEEGFETQLTAMVLAQAKSVGHSKITEGFRQKLK